MKTLFATIALTICGLPIAAHASQIVNVNAAASTGSSITLGAGTYQVNVIGTSQGGAYNGWNYATANFNSPSATPAPNAWVDSFAITIGGVTTSYVAAGNPAASDALGALSNYQNSLLYANSATPANGNILNSAVFTIGSTQCVNFTAADYLFIDNWGGLSLKVSPVAANATPEPSTFGMFGLALLGTIGAVRRKFAR